jgi:hypothetical protein
MSQFSHTTRSHASLNRPFSRFTKWCSETSGTLGKIASYGGSSPHRQTRKTDERSYIGYVSSATRHFSPHIKRTHTWNPAFDTSGGLPDLFCS